MTSTSKVILARAVDWDPWISFVRKRAKASRIWDHVDPSLPDKPAQPEYPVKPTLTRLQGGGIDPTSLEAYKLELVEYRAQLAEYERQEKAFGDLIGFIQDTVAAHNVVFIQNEDHPWNILRALKNRLAPSDEVRSLAIEQKYQKLCKGPGTQDIDTWMDQWTATYTEATNIPIGEVAGVRPMRDFLMAIRQREPTFADNHLINLKHKTNSDDLFELIEDFRQHIHLQHLLHPSKSGEHTAFVTKSGGKSGAPFRGQSQQPQPTKPCLCGETHWISNCFYLVPERRPQGWKPNAGKQKKVDGALQDGRTRAWVEKLLEKYNDKRNNSQRTSLSSVSVTPAASSSNQSASTGTRPQGANWDTGAYVCSSFSAATWLLQGSWILSSGSNSHVCNRTMHSRFTKTHDARSTDKLRAGTQVIPIECFGTIQISINSPIGFKTMALLNVAYIADFMTNLVSQTILSSKRLYFDNWKMHLHREGETIGFVEEYNGLYIMENNMNADSVAASSAFATVKTGTMNDWHQVLGHASHEAIKHLENATQGVKVSDTTRVPKTNECETCALSQSHRIISRSSDKSESSDKPFHRVTYDLMQFDSALNNHQWVSHFACSSTDFNLVFTHARKCDATPIIEEALAIIENRFNGKVVFFRSDGEKSLGIEYIELIASKGITYESSAPDTPAQNGHSERKESILAIARAMRIDAGLPEYLWNEVIKTAGYIANRTPMQKHGWKTPFEMVLREAPNLSHLRKIGCKAYALDKHIPRKQKLRERAHIGHLIGDSTNIFRIWIPSQRKIIRTRDVQFDENSFYSTSKPETDLSQLTLEPMIEMTYAVPPLSSSIQITESESDEDEWLLTSSNIPNVGTDEEKVVQHTKPDDIQLPTPDGSTPDGSERSSSQPLSQTLPDALARANAQRADEVSADLDEANISPEGVTRRKQKTSCFTNGSW